MEDKIKIIRNTIAAGRPVEEGDILEAGADVSEQDARFLVLIGRAVWVPSKLSPDDAKNAEAEAKADAKRKKDAEAKRAKRAKEKAEKEAKAKSKPKTGKQKPEAGTIETPEDDLNLNTRGAE